MRVEMVNISDTKMSFVRDNCTLSFHCLYLGKNDASVAGGIVRAREVLAEELRSPVENGVETLFRQKNVQAKSHFISHSRYDHVPLTIAYKSLHL